MPKGSTKACCVLAGLLTLSPAFHCQAAAPPSFTRGPFVSNATTNSIQIIWRTSAPADTSVEYGPTDALGTLLADPTPVTNHVVTLPGLAAGATYFYRASSVNDDGTLQASVEHFHTLSSEGPVRFVVVGDSLLESPGLPAPTQTQLVKVMTNLNPDLVVHLGDIVENGLDDTGLTFFNIFQPQLKNTPYYVCIGNHDLNVGDYDSASMNFQSTFYLPTNSVDGTEKFYSFDHGDVHFVCLYNPWFAAYVFTDQTPQYAWLTNDLATSCKPWKLIFLHMPIASSSFHAGDDYDGNGIPDDTDVMGLLLPVAERYGVQMIFGSHDHCLERFAPTNGVHHCVSGGGGRPLYPMNNRHPASDHYWATYHCLNITITNDTMAIQPMSTFGTGFDAWTVQKALPPPQVYHASWNTPVLETGAATDFDGNITGQSFDFTGAPIYPRSGRFSNLGRVHVNNDATHLYVGFEQVMIYANNNVFLFIEAPGLAGVTNLTAVGNGVIDPDGQGADGLDVLKNLSFTNFAPGIGCLLGDEYADGQFRRFARSSLALNIGQGIYRLDPELSDVPEIRLQQYNYSPQVSTPMLNGIGLEQNANFIELAIPFSELGGLRPGDTIKLGAVVGGGGFDTNAMTRELDTSVLGYSLDGSGQDSVVLEGVSVQLAFDPTCRVQLMPLSSNQFLLTWSAIPGRSYDIEYAAELGDFHRLEDPALPKTATSTRETFVVSRPANESGFYRVRIVP